MTIEKHIPLSLEVVGSHHDFESATKIAAWQPPSWVQPDVQAFVLGLRPDPRFVYVHTIGMSDGDRYGPNLNGDIFTVDELLGMQSMQEAMRNSGEMRGVPMARLKTFEQARFFRHHDNKPTSPFFGDIPFVAWNDPMARAEMIVRIARFRVPELGMQGAPDIINNLEKRGYISVSMGTKIAFEQCTACGARNSDVKDRCNCLKYEMHSIKRNGVKVAAVNYGMRFFDLSDVGDNPADTIARSMAKVAGACPFQQPNAALDVHEAKVASPNSWMHKRSELEKHIPTEPTILDNVPYDVNKVTGVAEPFAEAELDTIAKTASSLKQAVSTLALAGVVLSPLELIDLTCRFEPEAKTASVAEDFHGFDAITLDNFSNAVYSAVCTKIAARSGFGTGTFPGPEWEPEKIAFGPAAEYYAFYRGLIGLLPKASFLKAASSIPALRDLHHCDLTKLNSGLHSLIHSGLSAPL